MPGGFFVAAVPQGRGMSELWHSRFKRGIYEADDFVSCLPTAKAVGYASTAPTGLNRRHIASHIHKRESVRLLAAGLGVIAAVAAGYRLGSAAAMRPLDGGVALPQAALRLLGVLWSVAASRLLLCCGSENKFKRSLIVFHSACTIFAEDFL